MKEYKIIAIHRPTGKQHEIGVEPTIKEALYTLDNFVEFEAEDVPSDWAFQVVDGYNNIVAYGKTLNAVRV